MKPTPENCYTSGNYPRYANAQWDAMKEQILTPEVIADYNRQHREIFRALHQRDAQLAQGLITQHLEKARDDLLQAISP